VKLASREKLKDLNILVGAKSLLPQLKFPSSPDLSGAVLKYLAANYNKSRKK